MSLTRSPGAPAGVLAPRPAAVGNRPARVRLEVPDALLPAGLALWGWGLAMTDVARLGPYGLPAILPGVAYVGLAVLLASCAWTLWRPQLSPTRLVLHLAGLLFVLYGSDAVLYREGRYSWLYKTIGVVQYVNLHGALNRHIDIYQNWPGFFALFAWFDRVAGIGSPLDYGKWAQLGFEALGLLMFAFAARGLPLTDRERWIALFIYPAANWVGQDYFSPQALGTVLSFGVLGVLLHWGAITPRPRAAPSSARSPRHRLARLRSRAGWAPRGGPVAAGAEARMPLAITALASLAYFVLVFTHELSPYIVLAQLTALALLGRFRPRWLVIAFAVIVFGFLAPRFSYVNQHFGILDSIGNFFANVLPPPNPGRGPTAAVAFSTDAKMLLSGAVGVAALVGTVRRYRAGRPVLALLVLAAAPVLVLAVQPYGGEAILRVYLFALPWAACLAAGMWGPNAAQHRAWAATGTLGTLAVIATLFFPAFFGLDAVNYFPSSQVVAIRQFYRTATPGEIFAGDANFAWSVTGRYNEFPVEQLFGDNTLLSYASRVPSSASAITQLVTRYTPPGEPAYVVLTATMQTYATTYQAAAPGELATLAATLRRAPGWSLAFSAPGVTVFEYPPEA